MAKCLMIVSVAVLALADLLACGVDQGIAYEEEDQHGQEADESHHVVRPSILQDHILSVQDGGTERNEQGSEPKCEADHFLHFSAGYSGRKLTPWRHVCNGEGPQWSFANRSNPFRSFRWISLPRDSIKPASLRSVRALINDSVAVPTIVARSSRLI